MGRAVLRSRPFRLRCLNTNMNALSIIKRALRRLGVLASGTEPTADEAADALECLQGILLRSIAEGALGTLTDVIATDDMVATENSRILLNDVLVDEISLPETVTENGTERPPRDSSVVVITDTFTDQTVTYIYDGDEGEWLSVETMTLTSKVPLSLRDIIGLSAYLAVEIADEYGQDVSETTAIAASRWHSTIGTNWSRQTYDPSENYF